MRLIKQLCVLSSRIHWFCNLGNKISVVARQTLSVYTTGLEPDVLSLENSALLNSCNWSSGVRFKLLISSVTSVKSLAHAKLYLLMCK